MGAHYPFTLADKLAVITEPCAWYTPEGGPSSPWGRAIIPIEMISVLLGSSMDLAGFRGNGPAVGLFAGQEIRLIQGPLFVDHPYELEREIVALSESARTESVWVRTRIFDGADARAGGRDDPQQRHAEGVVRGLRQRSQGAGPRGPRPERHAGRCRADLAAAMVMSPARFLGL